MKRGKNRRKNSRLPLEKDEQNWRLPSGESLEEFALHAGFVGSLLTVSEVLKREQNREVPEEAPARPIRRTP